MTGSARLGALDVVRICERSSEQHCIEKAIKLVGQAYAVTVSVLQQLRSIVFGGVKIVD